MRVVGPLRGVPSSGVAGSPVRASTVMSPGSSDGSTSPSSTSAGAACAVTDPATSTVGVSSSPPAKGSPVQYEVDWVAATRAAVGGAAVPVVDLARLLTGTAAPVARWISLRGGRPVDCGLAGTVMRFVPPIAAFAEGAVLFDGDPHARNRPMSTILDALRTRATKDPKAVAKEAAKKKAAAEDE